MDTKTDYKSFLASLKMEQRAALTESSDRPGLSHLAVHAGLIILLGALIAEKIAFWWLLIFPQAILLAFLFTLQHETVHKTPFASEGVNELVGRCAGLLICQPFTWFRCFHLAHHRFTNDPARDPELIERKPKSWAEFAWYLSTVGYWREKLALLLRNAFAKPDGDYVPKRAYPRIRREARVMLAIYAAAGLFSVTVSDTLIWVWLVPLAIGLPVLRLYLLAEHGRCPFVADMFDNTRTTYTNRIVRYVAWNMPYHTEHHIYPQVPYHRLPELHQLAKAHLRQTEPSYTAFTAHYLASFE